MLDVRGGLFVYVDICRTHVLIVMNDYHYLGSLHLSGISVIMDLILPVGMGILVIMEEPLL